jgi:hypothetical protein
MESSWRIGAYTNFYPVTLRISNMIQRLWRFLKKVVLYNRYYGRFTDFKGAILRLFANIQQYRLRARVSHDREISHVRHIGVSCLLRCNLAALIIFMGAKVALAEPFSFIFSKISEAGFMLADTQKSARDIAGSPGKNSDGVIHRNNVSWTSGEAMLPDRGGGVTYAGVAVNFISLGGSYGLSGMVGTPAKE